MGLENGMVTGAAAEWERLCADGEQEATDRRERALIELADRPMATIDGYELCLDDGVQAVIAEMLRLRAKRQLGRLVLGEEVYLCGKLLDAALRAMKVAE